MAVTKDGKGKRFNQGKIRWDLMPWLAVTEVAKVPTFGATKYEEWNWYRGMKYSISFGSGNRHRIGWWMGEDLDKESGINHLAHSAFNDLMNLTFQLEKRSNLDDRIKTGTEVSQTL